MKRATLRWELSPSVICLQKILLRVGSFVPGRMVSYPGMKFPANKCTHRYIQCVFIPNN
jgi:hypothetical protein